MGYFQANFSLKALKYKLQMKLLIYGHKGWIGQQVVALLIKRNSAGTTCVLGNARVDDTDGLRTADRDWETAHNTV